MRKLVTVLPAVALVLMLAGCGEEGTDDSGTAPEAPSQTAPSDPTEEPTQTPTEDPTATEPTGPSVACDYVPDGSASEVEPPSTDAPESGTVPVAVTTSVGALELALDATAAPCTVNSFVSLAEQGFFDGTTCHRLTTAGIFVLQCGDPTATGTGGPGYTIPDEFRDDMTYGPGTLAMAKTPAPDSGGSQFFIVYDGPDDQLPPAYTVFGEITAGLEQVQAAAADGTADGAPDGAPATPVDLETVTVG